jgi:hypothetical protein
LSEDVIRGVMESEGERVYRMIREIADDVLGAKGTVGQAAGIHAQRAADAPGGRHGTVAERPVELPPNIPAQALDIREHRPPGFRSHYAMAGEQFTEFRGQGTTAGNIRVQSPAIGGGAYSDIMSRITQLAPAGTPPAAVGPAVGSALTVFQQRGILPPGLPYGPQAAPTAAALTRLGAVEVARDPGYLVTRAATMEGLKQGLITPQQAFVDLNPMERATEKNRPGAPRTAAELQTRMIPGAESRYRSPLTGEKAQALPGEMERFMRVEREAIIRTVFARLQVTKPLFLSETDLRAYIRKELQDELARVTRRGYG